jgi:hypothetical protein
MLEMIVERQKSEKVERNDLLSNLLEANASDLEGTSLTETDLMGIRGFVHERFVANRS